MVLGARRGWLLFLALSFTLSACGHRFPGRYVLDWWDAETDTDFNVWYKPTLKGDWVWLSVVHFGEEKVKPLSRGSFELTHVLLVKQGEWLLVLNEEYVLGGYHFPTRRLFGEGEWDALPYTVHAAGGVVVARTGIRGRDLAYRLFPGDMPLRYEGVTTQSANRDQ